MALLRDGTGTPQLARDLAAPGVVLTEVYTPDCVICKRVEPMVAALQTQLGERIRTYKVDAARDPAFAERFEVRGLPTLLLFRDGVLAERRTGFMTTSMLKAWVNPHLDAGA
jgi:thioredoxin 1